MSMRTLDEGRASQPEAEKLVQEMRVLIEKKGLEVDLVSKKGVEHAEPVLASGCNSCTVCPCMICW